jgi:PPM family protein phosphatase
MLSFSEAGGHPANEDAFVVERHPADPDCWLCFLADGQGGRAGGARAAQLACRSAADGARQEPRWKLAAPSAWPALLRCADAAVSADPSAGFTTLIGFCIAADRLAGASCGDSAVLVTAAGEQPHEVTAGQPKNPPVGSGEARFAPFGATLTPPWAVLALSDGVWKYAGWKRLKESVLVERGQRLVERIQGYARLRGGGSFADDFTVVLFEEVAEQVAAPGRPRD